MLFRPLQKHFPLNFLVSKVHFFMKRPQYNNSAGLKSEKINAIYGSHNHTLNWAMLKVGRSLLLSPLNFPKIGKIDSPLNFDPI